MTEPKKRKTRSNDRSDLPKYTGFVDGKNYATGKSNALSAKQIDLIAYHWRQQHKPARISAATGFSINTVRRYIGYFERDAALGSAPVLQELQERLDVIEQAYLRSDCRGCQTEIVYLRAMPQIMCPKCSRVYDRTQLLPTRNGASDA